MEEFVATWDTGATHCVISQSVIEACDLKPIGTTTMFHAQGVTENVDIFLADIELPNGIRFTEVLVIRGVLDEEDVLIGMDIINKGDFAVTNPGGNAKLSFRFPSQANIDFVMEDRGNDPSRR